MDEETNKNDAPSEGDGDTKCQCEAKTEVKVVEENLDYKDAHARAVADYDNLKKETARLRGEYARYAACEVVEQMLPVLDNLNKALESAPDGCDQWVDGIKLIREQFQKVMEAAGVQPLGAEGEEFNPVIHEALMREARDGAKSDTVVQVIEPGYKMHDKTLRPAKVVVAE
jgi:molecular chaperone GrpE